MVSQNLKKFNHESNTYLVCNSTTIIIIRPYANDWVGEAEESAVLDIIFMLFASPQCSPLNTCLLPKITAFGLKYLRACSLTLIGWRLGLSNSDDNNDHNDNNNNSNKNNDNVNKNNNNNNNNNNITTNAIISPFPI